MKRAVLVLGLLIALWPVSALAGSNEEAITERRVGAGLAAGKSNQLNDIAQCQMALQGQPQGQTGGSTAMAQAACNWLDDGGASAYIPTAISTRLVTAPLGLDVNKAPACPAKGRGFTRSEENALNDYAILKARAEGQGRTAPPPPADVAALQAC
jgi:hypothetical protein